MAVKRPLRTLKDRNKVKAAKAAFPFPPHQPQHSRRKEYTTMKCITINNHDYATRAHGDPTANAALSNIMRQMPRPRPPRIRYTTDGRTQVVRYA